MSGYEDVSRGSVPSAASGRADQVGARIWRSDCATSGDEQTRAIACLITVTKVGGGVVVTDSTEEVPFSEVERRVDETRAREG